MQCFTELTPPTAVTHSLSLPFTAADATNLVVAKTSLLQIFAVKGVRVQPDPTDIDEAAAEPGASLEDGIDTVAPERFTTKLVLVAEYALAGTITSMARIQTESKSGGACLLLSFRDAKLSLVEWDPEQHDLSTISIHYYEQEDLGSSPWDPCLADCVNYLVADPQSRCAALKFGARSLAILPFRQADEDAEMDDWDEELDGPRPAPLARPQEEGPYAPSFVLRLSSLDPALIHPIHLAFLYEYREPTFAILSSMALPSTAMLEERRDQVTYMVFTLDLTQKASTTILVVSGLPYDLFQVVPLPSPVGGALLVGGNELIHIDQSGKTNGVAVNPLAKASTSFGLADQSDLGLRLEGCVVEQLSIENGEVLLVLNSGELAILTFRMDGRSVSGLNVRRVGDASGGLLLGARASCTSRLGRSTMFIGSEEADPVVLGWAKAKQPAKRRSPEENENEDEDVDAMDLHDEDDLYGDAPIIPAKAAADSARIGEYSFRIHDSLVNIAPLRDITFSRPEAVSGENPTSELELVGVSGRNKSGALAIMKREVEPHVIGRFDFPEARGVWTMSAKKPFTKSLMPDKPDAASRPEGAQFDRLMIVSKTTGDAEESSVYALTAAGFEALADTEFDPAAGETIECGTLGAGMRIIQVLKSEVRSYDGGMCTPFPFPSLIDGLNTHGQGPASSWSVAIAHFHSMNGNYIALPLLPRRLLASSMCTLVTE